MMTAGGRRSTAARARHLTSIVAPAFAAVAALTSCAVPERAVDTAVVASGADLESANPLVTVHPLSRQVQRFVLFVTLARYDSTLTPVPYAARRWHWSADRRALTVVMHPGLRWHDGQPMTAHDAAFTFSAARDPLTGSPRASELASIDSIAAPDDTTLVLRFAGAQPVLPAALAELPIVPEHLLRDVPRAQLKRAAFTLAPVGGGPFRFVERRAGSRWLFERNDDFPAALGGPPRLRRIVIAVVDEPTTKFAGLVSGDLDLAGIAPTAASLVAQDPRLRVLAYPVLFANALVFNVARPPFDDVRVRRAIDLSLDRSRIIDAALAGYGTPASGPVSPDNPLALPADSSAARPDPRRADSLLDAAGWRRGANGVRVKNGRPLHIELLTVGSGDNPTEQLIQADLRDRGIQLEVRTLEMGALLQRVRDSHRDFDVVLTGIPGDLGLSYLSAMYSTAAAGGALDYSGYHTPALDTLLARTRAATSAAELRDAWFGVQRELARELPAAWLYHSRGVQGVARRLNGVTMDLRGELATVARWNLGAPTAH
jgi:peptide/nickel transport system substrate-binding protein